jgi:hypothetical protein
MKTNIIIIALWVAFSGGVIGQTNPIAMTTNVVDVIIWKFLVNSARSLRFLHTTLR